MMEVRWGERRLWRPPGIADALTPPVAVSIWNELFRFMAFEPLVIYVWLKVRCIMDDCNLALFLFLLRLLDTCCLS